jgi:hypothetical protein
VLPEWCPKAERECLGITLKSEARNEWSNACRCIGAQRLHFILFHIDETVGGQLRPEKQDLEEHGWFYLDERDRGQDLLEQGGRKEEEKGDFSSREWTRRRRQCELFNVGPDDHMAMTPNIFHTVACWASVLNSKCGAHLFCFYFFGIAITPRKALVNHLGL